MQNSVVPNDVDEFSSVLAGLGEQSLTLSTSPNASIDASPTVIAPEKIAPSYQAYPWSLPNRILDIVDTKTNGRAGQVQRVITYLFFGGTAALVNLAVFYVMYHLVLGSMPKSLLHNTLSYIVAAELSIFANFIPNDRFTFNTLPGAQRPWFQRCMRFHMTCIVGVTLTFLIELGLSTFTKIDPLIAEAIATLIVLIYNFSAHHLFTYRHVKHA